MNTNTSIRKLTTAALIAALYTVISLAFAPISFGAVQFRIAEALTLLAIFSPEIVVAITLGCALTNVIGFSLGINPLLLDVFFGTFATAVAGFLSWKMRRIRIKGYAIPSAIPPIIINAIVIGAEITWLETGAVFKMPNILLLNSLYIGASQVIPCLVFGVMLAAFLERTGIAQKYLLEVD